MIAWYVFVFEYKVLATVNWSCVTIGIAKRFSSRRRFAPLACRGCWRWIRWLFASAPPGCLLPLSARKLLECHCNLIDEKMTVLVEICVRCGGGQVKVRSKCEGQCPWWSMVCILYLPTHGLARRRRSLFFELLDQCSIKWNCAKRHWLN